MDDDAPRARRDARTGRELADAAIAGDQRALARAITLAESGEGDETLAVLRAASAGKARVIGVTGPPGAGKSTLVDKLVRRYRDDGLRVGVIAVDPSSPYSGGAILGDRIRMQRHALDEGVFIRSLASRGHLGGVSSATGDAIAILDAAGYDRILVETVGVGQSEVEIVRLADVVALVSVPGLGDDIQVIKAGIMEIGDVFIVNKADREGADRVVREIRMLVETGLANRERPDAGTEGAVERSHHVLARDADRAEEAPAIVKTVAETGEGVDEAARAIEDFRARIEASGELARRRLARARQEIKDALFDLVERALENEAGDETERLARDVAAGTRGPREAAATIARLIMKEEGR